MEDLATDRVYRLMIAQRMRHGGVSGESGQAVSHTPDFIDQLFDEELNKLLADSKYAAEGGEQTFREARQIAESMVMREEFNPV
jgi:malate synthase